MSNQNPTPGPAPAPWNFNARGASLTFTNAGGKAYVYYFCLIDFPSAFDLQHEVTFQPNGVSVIPNTGQYNYNPAIQYLQVNGTIVYYSAGPKPGFYSCIADTPSPAGPFNPACWQYAGANVYQLNFLYNDGGDGWPNPQDGATPVTYNLPLFRTVAGYDPTMGPIVNMSVTNKTTPNAVTGDPNWRRPPIVNLPLRAANGGTAGTPILAIFSSLTFQTGQNYWVLACVNTVTPGFANAFTIHASTPNYIATLNPGPAKNPVAAVGVVQANDANPIGGIAITGCPIIPVPVPMSSNPLYYTM